MKDFFVPKDLLLFSNSMGMSSDFSVRGFSGGQAEDSATLTITVSSVGEPWTPMMLATGAVFDICGGTGITYAAGQQVQRIDDAKGGSLLGILLGLLGMPGMLHKKKCRLRLLNMV